MKVVVLADDDGYIVAMGVCRMSHSGQAGTLNEPAEIRAQMRRSDLDQLLGRPHTSRLGSADDLVTSIIVDLPTELDDTPLPEIQRTMVLDRSGAFPQLTLGRKSG
jgi:hypothetical protein